jgi:hypothetical protein
MIMIIAIMLLFGLLWSLTIKPCPDGTVTVLGTDRWFCVEGKEP